MKYMNGTIYIYEERPVNFRDMQISVIESCIRFPKAKCSI